MVRVGEGEAHTTNEHDEAAGWKARSPFRSSPTGPPSQRVYSRLILRARMTLGGQFTNNRRAPSAASTGNDAHSRTRRAIHWGLFLAVSARQNSTLIFFVERIFVAGDEREAQLPNRLQAFAIRQQRNEMAGNDRAQVIAVEPVKERVIMRGVQGVRSQRPAEGQHPLKMLRVPQGNGHRMIGAKICTHASSATFWDSSPPRTAIPPR